MFPARNKKNQIREKIREQIKGLIKIRTSITTFVKIRTSIITFIKILIKRLTKHGKRKGKSKSGKQKND